MKAKDQQLKMKENMIEAQKLQIQKQKLAIDKKASRIDELTLTKQKLLLELNKNDVTKNHVLRQALIDNLTPKFTVAQVDRLLGFTIKSQWSEEDIARAVTLKSYSAKSYEYMRKHLKFPLPCETSIRKWIREINCEPGVQNSCLKVMNQKGADMAPQDRACILLFDEMSVAEEYCYDVRTDRIYNPHSKVQVVMAVGLIGRSWRQPIYYDFDRNMTPALVNHLITSLEKQGFPVYAVVSDLGGTNHGLLGKMCVSTKEPHFENPYNKNRNVHFFCDVPHMIKLLRNNLLDHQFRTPKGITSKEPLWELIRHERGVFKTAHKISESNLTVAGSQRQRVKTAVQLLSNSVGLSLKHMKEKGVIHSQACDPTAELILLADQWYDILNVSHYDNAKLPFMGDATQVKILKDMIDLMEKSRIIRWNDEKQRLEEHFYPFQKGIIISSLSLMNLFHELRRDYPKCEYLLTARLNQDPVEHFFGVIRSMEGPFDAPNPVVFVNRIKKYMLGRRSALTASQPNTTCATECIKLTETHRNTLKLFQKFSSPMGSNIQSILRTRKEVEKAVDYQSTERSASLTGKVLIGVIDDTMEEDELDTEEFELPDYEADGFLYVLGFIAHKYEELRESTQVVTGPYASWIDRKSRGNLKHMRRDYITHFKKMEQIFRKHHGNQIVPQKNAVGQLFKECSNLALPLNDKVILFYLRCRLHFEIKFRNKQLRKDKKNKNLSKLAKLVA